MKTVINIKADKDVKANAQKVARELGLPLSTLINAYLKQFIRNKAAYFSAAPRMTAELEASIGRARHDFNRKKNISPAFSSGSGLDDYLDAL